MRLVDEQTDEEISIGNKVTTFRGEEAILLGWREPHNATSTGRVHIKTVADGLTGEFYPGVIGAKIVE